MFWSETNLGRVDCQLLTSEVLAIILLERCSECDKLYMFSYIDALPTMDWIDLE